MRKYWSLTRIFAKTLVGASFGIKIGGKERAWVGVLLWIIIVASLAPILWLVYSMMSGVLGLFYALGQLPTGVGYFLNIGSIMIFVFSFMAAPALFYFAKDVEYVLPLPLRAEQIIGAKFTLALALEYVISLALMGTMFWALRGYMPTGVLTFNTIITLLTLPILPLVYSTVLVMLLLRVTRFGRNPDRYTMIVGILGVGLALGISIFAGQALELDFEAMVYALVNDQVLTVTLNTIFFTNIFAARAFAADVIFGGALHNQVINLGLAVAAVLAFFALARVLYFAGVIGLSESGAPTKKMTAEDISRNAQGRGRFSAYVMKELRLLFRSPPAFMNCVLVAFIMPVILGASLIPLANSGELAVLMDMINFADPEFVTMALVAMCAFGFVMGGFVLVTSTSISREGRNLFIMKYLPVRYATQLNAKATSGLVITLPAMLLVVVPLQIIVKAPIWILLCGMLLALLAAVCINYLGLYIDLLRPKLIWDNETTAVKQNINGMIVMFGSWVVCAALIFLGMRVLSTPLAAFLGLLGFTGLLTFVAYYLAIHVGKGLIERLY